MLLIQLTNILRFLDLTGDLTRAYAKTFAFQTDLLKEIAARGETASIPATDISEDILEQFGEGVGEADKRSESHRINPGHDPVMLIAEDRELAD